MSRCLNCDAPVEGLQYCGRCGQKVAPARQPFGTLFKEVLEEALQIDGRIARTLFALLFRPGHLTAEHNDGRRVRYTSPLKLYLATSVLYFFGLSFLQPDVPGLRIQGGNVTISSTSDGGVEEEEQVLALDAGVPVVEEEPRPPTKKKDGFLHELGERFQKSGENLAKKPPGEAVQLLWPLFVDFFAKAMILLLPLLALAYKVFYWRRYYVEHIVFVLHVHSFLYIALLGSYELSKVMGAWPALVIPVYLWVAQRRVYGEGWARTTMKLMAIGFVYMILLGFMLAGGVAGAFLRVS